MYVAPPPRKDEYTALFPILAVSPNSVPPHLHPVGVSWVGYHYLLFLFDL